MRFKGISSEVYMYAVPTQGIPEIVKQNRDGSFTVLIDENLNREQQSKLTTFFATINFRKVKIPEKS